MLYFIRHGESEGNVRNVFTGQKDDSPLTEKGREQARTEGAKIKELGLKIDAIVSSPLSRAFDTAKIVAEIIGYDKEIIVDPRITEYDMGALTGVSLQAISSEGAEKPEGFYQRVHEALAEWNKKEGNVLLASHAGVGRIIETIKTNGDPALFFDVPPYPNASVTKLDWLA